MSVCWLFGPPPSSPSSPPVTISRTVSSNSCGDPAPQSSVLKGQAPLQTPSPATLPILPTRSSPPRALVLAPSSVSSLQPRIPVSMAPVLVIRKRVPWLPRKRPNVPGMAKSTPSMSTQTHRSLVPLCYMLVCTMAWLLDSVCVSHLPPQARRKASNFNLQSLSPTVSVP